MASASDISHAVPSAMAGCLFGVPLCLCQDGVC